MFTNLCKFDKVEMCHTPLIHKTDKSLKKKIRDIYKIHTENMIRKTIKAGRRDTKSLSHIYAHINAITNTDKED